MSVGGENFSPMFLASNSLKDLGIYVGINRSTFQQVLDKVDGSSSLNLVNWGKVVTPKKFGGHRRNESWNLNAVFTSIQEEVKLFDNCLLQIWTVVFDGFGRNWNNDIFHPGKPWPVEKVRRHIVSLELGYRDFACKTNCIEAFLAAQHGRNCNQAADRDVVLRMQGSVALGLDVEVKLFQRKAN
ncbi:hypothetical protein PIB30_023849 [Stylosanthes scabra]|uniref:Uncharacterized protein n=1 Tax=Stylosanthes scabra TaxID=79078 RepID=A0ABU6RA15_9FABA|nr:hypothetical protein [Stylosanthes scabra]